MASFKRAYSLAFSAFFRMVGDAKHLILLADGEVVTAEVLVFEVKRALSVFLLTLQSLRSLFGGVRIKNRR